MPIVRLLFVNIYERGNYSPADHSYFRLYKRTHTVEVRGLTTSLVGGGAWTRPYYSSISSPGGGLVGAISGEGLYGLVCGKECGFLT